MKVICINAGVISSGRWVSYGEGLVKDKIYTVAGECIDSGGDECYILSELVNHTTYNAPNGAKLKCRFRPLDTDWIDEAIEKALNEEP